MRRCRLDPVHVPHEDRVLELDVRLVLILELLGVECPDASAELEDGMNAVYRYTDVESLHDDILAYRNGYITSAEAIEVIS